MTSTHFPRGCFGPALFAGATALSAAFSAAFFVAPLNVYAHVSLADKREALDRLGSLFAEADEEPE